MKRHLDRSPRRSFVPLVLTPEVRIPFNNFLESLPSSHGARFESLWKLLDKLDVDMVTKGPVDARTRADFRTRASFVAKAAALENPSARTKNDHRLLITRAREVLRDIPVEGIFTRAVLDTLLRHGEAAVGFFLEIYDFPNLARALIALGNLYRVAGHEREATQKYTWALHILKQKCNSAKPAVAMLLHEAECWRLRLRGKDIEQPEIDAEISMLARVAHELNEPCLSVVHHREVAGFASYLLNDAERVGRELEELESARLRLTNHTTIGDNTLITPEIEFLFEHDRDDEAIGIIRSRYIPAYLRNRSQYNYLKIVRWCSNKWKAAIPPPEYAGALLTYLPRYSPQLV